MHLKEHTKIIVFKIFNAVKPLGLAIALIVILQTTGLISSVSYFSQWAVLHTGLKDASDEADEGEEKFDYNFTIKDLTGKRINFEEFKGKVIFLNVWATWCGPCRAEMEGIQNLYTKIGKGKATFIMLSLDKDSDTPKIVDYLKKKGFTFNAYQPSGYLTKQLSVPSIPTTFVISRDGKVVRKEVGGMRYDTSKFQKFLEGLSAN
jgi:thiol-disulfide isomerase/thioredoxin